MYLLSVCCGWHFVVLDRLLPSSPTVNDGAAHPASATQTPVTGILLFLGENSFKTLHEWGCVIQSLYLPTNFKHCSWADSHLYGCLPPSHVPCYLSPWSCLCSTSVLMVTPLATCSWQLLMEPLSRKIFPPLLCCCPQGRPYLGSEILPHPFLPRC